MPEALQELLATIVEAAPFAILVVGVDGRIVFANRGAELLFGYAHDELLMLDVEALVPTEVRELHRAHRAGFALQPRQRPMAVDRALSARRKDGSAVAVEVALKPINYISASFVLAVIVDVTDRRRLEQSLIRAHAELEHRIDERTAELARANAEKERLFRDLEVKSRELERLSLEDPLTGLSNRRDLDRRLQECIRSSQRMASPLTIALFDIDHFKRVNDNYGHAVGDEVLKDAANLLRRESRAIDVVARYGGEEFALVFPNVGLTDAIAICERVRRAFERLNWSLRATGLSLTISAGVASWRPDMQSEELLEAADLAMYEAKRSGRNRVMGQISQS